MEHPAADALLRFLLGAASRQENRQIVRHLLSRCPACAAALQEMKPEPPVDPDAYDEVLDRFAARLRELAGAGRNGRPGRPLRKPSGAGKGCCREPHGL